LKVREPTQLQCPVSYRKTLSQEEDPSPPGNLACKKLLATIEVPAARRPPSARKLKHLIIET
jgi:hypothetical protein